MDHTKETGVFLSLRELEILFPRLKNIEHALDQAERKVLLKFEKILYEHLSVKEVEELLQPGTVASAFENGEAGGVEH
ncbi:hypothetical protein AGMMS49991_04710 [Spirochaetia bacterium]|nr:hypothetical protein AGMMS49991_04710 [Spirochaetia bacterium]